MLLFNNEQNILIHIVFYFENIFLLFFFDFPPNIRITKLSVWKWNAFYLENLKGLIVSTEVTSVVFVFYFLSWMVGTCWWDSVDIFIKDDGLNVH